jgi:CHAT domain-containing protein
MDLRRLRGTREEVREIAGLLILRDDQATDLDRRRLLEVGEERSASFSTHRFDLRLGSAVDRSLFRRDLSGYTHLHIGVHGYVDPRDPRRTGLVVGYEPENEGLLAIEEVSALHLDADLAVLSACDTARGSVVRGEGVESLANAFLEAGARAVIATLWELDDRSAADLMKVFYQQHLGAGLPAGQALRRAKIDFRESGISRGSSNVANGSRGSTDPANPYYWSAFVYVGPSER